jgi:hypothetical protein
MHPIKLIAVRYDTSEDRILVAFNAGSPEESSFWLTRRLALMLLNEAMPILQRTSALGKLIPAEHQADLTAMERDAALASVSSRLSPARAEAIKSARHRAETAIVLRLSHTAKRVSIIVERRTGLHASGTCSRTEFQRFLYMIEKQIDVANWRLNEGQPAGALSSFTAKKRRAN